MKESKTIILFGGGGHCKSVIDVAESAGYTILGILDKSELVGTPVLDYKVIGEPTKRSVRIEPKRSVQQFYIPNRFE